MVVSMNLLGECHQYVRPLFLGKVGCGKDLICKDSVHIKPMWGEVQKPNDTYPFTF